MTAADIELALAVLGAVLALAALIFSAGRFSENVKANTEATKDLSRVIDGHLTWSYQIVREHDKQFADQDKRISAADLKADHAHARIDDMQKER